MYSALCYSFILMLNGLRYDLRISRSMLEVIQHHSVQRAYQCVLITVSRLLSIWQREGELIQQHCMRFHQWLCCLPCMTFKCFVSVRGMSYTVHSIYCKSRLWKPDYVHETIPGCEEMVMVLLWEGKLSLCYGVAVMIWMLLEWWKSLSDCFGKLQKLNWTEVE